MRLDREKVHIKGEAASVVPILRPDEKPFKKVCFIYIQKKDTANPKPIA